MGMNFYRRAGALLLCFSLIILPGCSPDTGDTEEAVQEAFKEEAPKTVTSASDGLFGISYVSEEGLNPYSVSGSTNLSVCGLIYDCLFTVDEDFGANPVLCEAYTTNEDSTEYKFEIRSGIKFSDGTEMTVADIIYSITCAKDSKLYGERLTIIEDVSAAVDEEGEEIADTIAVSLKKAHGDLPVLLNVPIIMYGSLYEDNPGGTGPYVYSDSGPTPILNANTNYWGGGVPIEEIYLMEVEDAARAFENETLDLISLDPTNTSLSLTGSQGVRVYNTSVMEFIGFNMSKIPDANIRRAISSAINREEIIQTCLRSSCTPTPLPIHPSSSYYSSELAQEYGYDMDMAKELISKAQLPTSSEPTGFSATEYKKSEDEGEDQEADTGSNTEAEAETVTATATASEAEAASASEAEAWLTLKLLVCSDSTARFESAKMIADSLKRLGIDVTVVGKNYDDYIKALESGSFDLYYGQVKLKADFDLSSLITASGSINYTKASDSEYSTLISQFLAAGESAKAAATGEMCRYILENAPISVIGFKQMNVITKQGVVVDMEPHQDNIFGNITEWKITV